MTSRRRSRLLARVTLLLLVAGIAAAPVVAPVPGGASRPEPVLLTGPAWSTTSVLATRTGSAAGSVTVPAVGLPATADDLTPGLTVDSAVTYTVDLPGSIVHVDGTVTLTNVTPSTATTYYSFPQYQLGVLPGATAITVTRDGGRALSFTEQPGTEEYIPSLLVNLSPALLYGQTQTVHVTYDLAASDPRAASYAQVNAAQATFLVLPDGDPGQASVAVVVPDGPDVEVVGSALTETSDGGTRRWTAEGIADPAEWRVQVVVRDDDLLVETTVDHGDGVRVVGWPNDPEWLAFTSDLAERGLPVLEDVIGMEWGSSGVMEIREAATPSAFGFAGWYAEGTGVIEIDSGLDAHVTLHEMSHAWFNGEAFRGRWLNEGLAEEFSAAAMEPLGLERPVPDAVDPAAEGAARLDEWTDDAITSGATDDPASELYAYRAAWTVMHRIAEDIGTDGLAVVVRAAIEGQDAYPASTDTTGTTGPTGAHRFLDLAEGVGGSQQAVQAYRELVVGADGATVLDARAAAREQYQALLDAGDGWAPPAVVRDAMASWDFTTATEGMPRVAAVLTQRDALTDELAAIDASLPTAMQAQVEGSEDLAVLETLMADAASAVDGLTTAVRAEQDAGPIARVGLLVGGADGSIADARAALDEGDYAAAARESAAAADAVGAAATIGGLLIGGVLVIVAGAVVAILLVRRSRAGRSALTSTDVGQQPPQNLYPGL
ncbi:MAG TPA: hypothetical protein VGC67_08685 [Cellulomonas sp.]